MNKRLSVLIWAGAGIAIPVALFALFGKIDRELALDIISYLVACVLFLHVLSHLIRKVAAWIERHLGIILTFVAVGLVLSWHLDESNLLWTFLLVALMLGLIWWQWTLKKRWDKVARTIALRILDNLDGTWQQALSDIPELGPNAQQRIKKAIREELRRRPADEIALMFLDGSAEMQELMGESLSQMPIKMQRDIKRAIKEEKERRRREAQNRPTEEWEIDHLFEENIEENADKIALRFFSGEFQHREYVIKKIRETNAEVQHRLEQAIREKQETLLNDPQTLMPGDAFVYLIRQEDFANKQSFFKIGKTTNPGDRLGKLQTGNPHLLHLWAAMSFSNYTAAGRKERSLHRVCQAWQVHGEWFQGHARKELLRVEGLTPYFNIP